MYNGLRRLACLEGRRLLAPPVAKAVVKPQQLGTQLRFMTQQRLFTGPAFTRPLSALSTSVMPRAPWAAASEVCKESAAAKTLVTTSLQNASMTAAPIRVVEEAQKTGMVFEIGLSFVVSHYIHIFISLSRCLFQAFRPILIAFVFGQILKAVFFVMGTPIWLSFYSIWMFEVFYGLVQCIISFIFISFFYNNLSFQQMRPALRAYTRQLMSQARVSLAKSRAMMQA
eukprot:gnl/MRDRNA2_/MRDRNA2_144140_c0_seq1.p1 gnl/MRDRNA2_/MRDRNA2_144140_c0~~gnl/MRDRNA2_/MRDRNA2_144140_c0_seq1.p1  ORF type:complete len:227 (+),score=34.40 gnl/MRDRNA2_/MRDRNA2_144140_c0_seq1:71-751(+)